MLISGNANLTTGEFSSPVVVPFIMPKLVEGNFETEILMFILCKFATILNLNLLNCEIIYRFEIRPLIFGSGRKKHHIK
jgi:hypothetical protein